uniref:Putative tick salivary metalloprotease n=1 Tax=Rhipicephalus pulchellus TaxID=72859 RepID=L7LRE5_RHIPC
MITIFSLSFVFNLWFSSATKEHVIVYPRLLSSRGSNEEKLLRINQQLTLNLKRSKVFSGNFMFISEENGVRIHIPMRTDDFEENLYHDDELMASVMVRTKDGVIAEGVINSTQRIMPLLGMARSEDGGIPHQLFEIEPQTPDPPKHRDYEAANITAREDGLPAFIEARSAQKTLYPEIHIVQDYAHAKAFGFRKSDVTVYFAVLFNAINLRYKKNRSVKIQLRIAAITMSTKVEQYFAYADRSRHQILDVETLERFNSYYKTNVEFKTTDLTFLVTGLDMVFYESGVLQTWTGGYTYVGGFCQESKVGMSEDIPGSYIGVTVLAHEIGHSLGCVHDGDSALSEIPGHRGSANCPWKDGYMMSYVRKNTDQYKFSPCCIADIKNVLSRPEWKCLKKRTREPIKRPGYPGQYISGSDYCRRCYPSLPNIQYDKRYGIVDCTMRCANMQDDYLLGVPDGVPCDAQRKGKKRCMLGKCVESRSE